MDGGNDSLPTPTCCAFRPTALPIKARWCCTTEMQKDREPRPKARSQPVAASELTLTAELDMEEVVEVVEVVGAPAEVADCSQVRK